MPIREHIQKGNKDHNLIMWMKFDGDLMEEVSGLDMAAMFGWPNTQIRNWRWFNDPAGSGTQCIARSSTKGANGNLQGFPSIIVDTREYRADVPTQFKPFRQCPSSAYSDAAINYLLGYTLEFEWYPNANSAQAYLLESYDGIYGNNTNMYGAELYRQGTNLIMKFRTGTKTLCSFSNGRWYKISIDFIDNHNNTYSTRFRVYDNDVLVADSDNITGMPTIPYGSTNRNNRVMCFFNSHYGYYAIAVNMTDYLRNVKVYKTAA